MISVKVQFISPGGSGLISQVAGPMSPDALTLQINMFLSTEQHGQTSGIMHTAETFKKIFDYTAVLSNCDQMLREH